MENLFNLLELTPDPMLEVEADGTEIAAEIALRHVDAADTRRIIASLHGYPVKPVSFDGFLGVIQNIDDCWLTLNVSPPL